MRCGRDVCAAELTLCHNYAVENTCNRCVLASAVADDGAQTLCDYCQLTSTIPDLSVPGNREKWYRLEVAKRRLLYLLDMLNLPYAPRGSEFPLPLSFEFKADVLPTNAKWRSMGTAEKVYTGHCRGVVTINIQEADDVEREKLRLQFQEAHRTLIGHFRHEMGHYYWELLVEPHRLEAFKKAFGDHEHPSYDEAKQLYYAQGPAPDWPTRFISCYASMHPWEDFAETFAAYLDLRAVIDTALHCGFHARSESRLFDFESSVNYYLQIGMMVNEFNREMGLLDLVPDLFNPQVVQKLDFVHRLVIEANTSLVIPRAA